MTRFLGPDFLLDTEPARRLYHEVAAGLPIVDYHNHLRPEDIAQNRSWESLGEIWLADDHYKWRLMRWAGINEERITGSADFRTKYNAFATALPRALGNPVHHWAHLELWRYFGLGGTVLSPETADHCWEVAGNCLARPDFRARGLLSCMNVELVATTDDPTDSLEHHRVFAAETDTELRMIPTFRPDRAFAIEAPDFTDWIERLSACARQPVRRWDDLLGALDARLDAFLAAGARAADHGIDCLEAGEEVSAVKLDAILSARLEGKYPDESETAAWRSALLIALGRAYAARDMVMQLHIGALRNTRSRLLMQVGRDAGGDSIRDRPIAEGLNLLLDRLDRSNELPRTILYALNPALNPILVTTAGNFQDGSRAGKVQAGAAWWFNDQLDGMQSQMTQLSQMGLISTFTGMLTDSRSLLSFPRHEYFRRLLCRMLGRWMQDGLVPNDFDALAEMVRDICYRTPHAWFARKSVDVGTARLR
ncbi:glucuronate isomerase [Oricola cellulosilytica]|uniref:Uronate isomerase n=1 Tax=Oricola cellulosilytica TaxID=1429082 RepID=A0A4R0PDP1_9HYPH|nr:glucuronate isomerase [Oricola cellulosilytica]TCD13356.1 glucuronate isomerase [Oricola cellulosilytica]